MCWFFWWVEKLLDKKAKFIFRIYGVINWKKRIIMHISPNAWRSNGNQTITFGSWYNITGEIFFVKDYTQYVMEKLVSDTKISSLNISLNQQSETSYNLFLLHVQVKNYRNMLKLTCRLLTLASHKAFLKNKKRFGTSLPESFSVQFSQKIFLHVTLY